VANRIYGGTPCCSYKRHRHSFCHAALWSNCGRVFSVAASVAHRILSAVPVNSHHHGLELSVTIRHSGTSVGIAAAQTYLESHSNPAPRTPPHRPCVRRLAPGAHVKYF